MFVVIKLLILRSVDSCNFETTIQLLVTSKATSTSTSTTITTTILLQKIPASTKIVIIMIVIVVQGISAAEGKGKAKAKAKLRKNRHHLRIANHLPTSRTRTCRCSWPPTPPARASTSSGRT